MLPKWSDLASKPEGAWLIAFAVLTLIASVLALRRYLRNRPTPEELERRRREMIHRSGKLGDGEIIDLEGAAIIYCYEVAGVGYTASQDLSALETLLPSDPASMIGPASIRFDPRNPANSIVICEQWSGL